MIRKAPRGHFHIRREEYSNRPKGCQRMARLFESRSGVGISVLLLRNYSIVWKAGCCEFPGLGSYNSLSLKQIDLLLTGRNLFFIKRENQLDFTDRPVKFLGNMDGGFALVGEIQDFLGLLII